MGYLNLCVLFPLLLLYFVMIQDADAEMNDKLRKFVLESHNKLRSTVALGQAVNKNGTKLPKAKNMYQLTYSKVVEKYAQELANTCNFSHKYFNRTSNNLALYGGIKYENPEVALNDSVYNWYGELAKDGQNSLVIDGTNFNHFTQMVWAGTKNIGCAIAHCPKIINQESDKRLKYTYVVCNYWPSGNVNTKYIYRPGKKTGSNCPKKTKLNKKTGLCKIKTRKDIHDD